MTSVSPLPEFRLPGASRYIEHPTLAPISLFPYQYHTSHIPHIIRKVMQSDMSNVVEDRQDVLSWVVNPGARPAPTRARLMGVLSRLMDGAIGKCCHSLVGLAEAAVVLLSPPSVKSQGEDSAPSIPGAYSDSGARNLGTGEGILTSYSCECTICARRDGLSLVGADGANAMAEEQDDHGADSRSG